MQLLEARCSAVTEHGRYCQRFPSSDRETLGQLGLPPSIQLCGRHLKWLIEWRDRRAVQETRDRLAEERQQARAATVYYVQRADGLIKIGYSARMQQRMSALRREHGPLTILTTHAGGRDAEQAQHWRFSEYRVTGEWFEPAPGLLAHIDHVNSRRATVPAQRKAA